MVGQEDRNAPSPLDIFQAENARLREELAAAHATIAQMRDLLDDCVNSLANYKLLQRRSNDPIGAEVTAKEISSIKSVLTLPTNLDALHEAQAKQEPAAWAYTINNSHSIFSAEKPPEDAYDEGTLYPLYAAPVVQPDILNDIDLILAGSHTEDCYAICGPGDETWVEEDKCNCAVGKARKLIAAAEGKSNA